MHSLFKNKKNILYVLSGALLAVMHVLILVLIYKRTPYTLDSDMASEMLLGKILSEENSILSRNWYYSTELHVLNIQLVYAFFFKFTSNWHHVRIFSDMVIHSILSGSVICFCHKANIPKYSFAAAVCTISALSETHFRFIANGCMYIPFISISYITIALTLMYSVSGKKKKCALAFILAFLSFAAGTGGIRQIVITGLPLTAAVIILLFINVYREGTAAALKSRYYAMLPALFISLAACGTGYMFNSRILSKYYTYKMWDTIRFTGLDYDKLSLVSTDMLMALGFTTGQVSLKTLASNCAFGIILLLTLWAVRKGTQKNASPVLKLMTVYFICNTAVYVLLYTFTDMPYTARYNLPVMIFVFPVILLAVHEADFNKLPSASRLITALFLMGAVLTRTWFVHDDMKSFNRVKTLNEVAEFISNSDYSYGYATFWNANVLTELTNGKAEMYAWRSSGGDGSEFSNTKDPDDLYRWLQKTNHINNPPEGKVFVLYRKNEKDHCLWKDNILPENLIYETEEYEVYGFESHDEMKASYSR